MSGGGVAMAEDVADSSDDFVDCRQHVKPLDSGKMSSGGRIARPKGGLEPSSGIRLGSSFAVNKVHGVFSTFAGEKRDLVNSIGFGGLLSLHKQHQISRGLAFWLLRNMDTDSNCFVVREGVKLKVSDSDVQSVLGLPKNGDALVRPKSNVARPYDAVKSMLRLGKNSEITLDYLESVLTKDYGVKMSTKDRAAFKVAAVIFADAYMLAPRGTTARINHSVMPYLVDPDSIHEVNWARYVLTAVKEASRKVKQSLSEGKRVVSLECCLIFLEIFYLDHLDCGEIHSGHMCYPRVSDYPYEKMRSMLALDKESAKHGKPVRFGKMKIRASDDNIYACGINNSTPTEKQPAQNTPRAATSIEGPSFLVQKLQELRANLEEERMVYEGKVDGLSESFVSSVTEFYHPGYAHDAPMSSVLSESAEVMFGVETPTCPSQRAAAASNTPIIVNSSPSDSSAMNSGYSAGPAFDKSGNEVPPPDSPYAFYHFTSKKAVSLFRRSSGFSPRQDAFYDA